MWHRRGPLPNNHVMHPARCQHSPRDPSCAQASKPEGKDALTDFKVKDIDGNDFNFSQYRGKVR